MGFSLKPKLTSPHFTVLLIGGQKHENSQKIGISLIGDKTPIRLYRVHQCGVSDALEMRDEHEHKQ